MLFRLENGRFGTVKLTRIHAWQTFSNLIQLPTLFHIKAGFMGRRQVSRLLLYGYRVPENVHRWLCHCRLCWDTYTHSFQFWGTFATWALSVLCRVERIVEQQKKVVTQEINVMCARALGSALNWKEVRVTFGFFFSLFCRYECLARLLCVFLKSAADGRLSTIEFRDVFFWSSHCRPSTMLEFFSLLSSVSSDDRRRWRNEM